MECLRPFSFSAVSFRGVTGTADANLTSVSQALAENRKGQEDAAAAIAANGGAGCPAGVRGPSGGRGSGGDLCPASSDGRDHYLLRRVGSCGQYAEGAGPAGKGGLRLGGCRSHAGGVSEVPVQLKNNWLTRPLNMVTEMYSLPAYDNVDPNPLMAPFFILFYGVMMADMGYGPGDDPGQVILITRAYRPRAPWGTSST